MAAWLAGVNRTFSDLEDLDCPTVAAINGEQERARIEAARQAIADHPLVKAAIGQDIDPESLGGAAMQRAPFRFWQEVIGYFAN